MSDRTKKLTELSRDVGKLGPGPADKDNVEAGLGELARKGEADVARGTGDDWERERRGCQTDKLTR